MAAQEPALVINRRITRPAAALVAALGAVPTGNVCDAMGRVGALDHRIKPVGRHSRFAGVALTVDAGPRDNLAAWAALDVAQPGDVVLVTTGDHEGSSVIGDVYAGMARNGGVVGLVTDGLVRDVAGIDAADMPTFARGVSPNSPWKNGPGSVGLRIAIGGVSVEAGDIVVADADGVVVVPQSRAEAVAAALDAVLAKERGMEGRVRAGDRAPGWLAEAYADKGVRYLD